MFNSNWVFGVLFLLGVAPTNSVLADQTIMNQRVEFYYGEVKFFSPDGKTPYGQTVSLVRRTINPTESKIIEEILQPARTPGQPPSEFIATMSRVGNSSTFDSIDAGKTFTGKMVFTSGPEWNWSAWDYSIELTEGGAISGSGTLSDQGIQTNKNFYDKAGNASVLLKEFLKPIPSEKYLELKKEMTKQ